MRHLHHMHSGYFKRHIRSTNNSRPSRPFNQVIPPQTSRPTPQDILTSPRVWSDFHVCVLCANVTTHKDQHYKHMRQEHAQYVSENWFHCSNCQLAFPDKQTLKSHSNSHSYRYTIGPLAPMLGDVDLDSIDFQLHWLQLQSPDQVNNKNSWKRNGSTLFASWLLSFHEKNCKVSSVRENCFLTFLRVSVDNC